MRTHVAYFWVVLLLLVCGCSSSTDGGGDLVTIAGIVRDVDTLEPAPGVRVRLLDRFFMDEVETGSDGAYELKVPRGTTLFLVTDDFSKSTNNWFPMINADYPPVVANDDILDFPIHACPQSIGKSYGSLAVYDNYLASQDDANGDIFVAKSMAECGGAVFVGLWGCENGSLMPDGYDMRVFTNTPTCPVAFVGTCIAANGWETACNPAMYPPTRTVADDVFGGAFACCAPASSGTMVGFTIQDTDPARNLIWQSDVQLPVRPGMLTLTIACFVDGAANIPFREFADACGLFGGP